MPHEIVQADAFDFLRSRPADSLDLVFGSPPYEAQRTYGIGFKLRGQDWVDWMVTIFREAARCCKGLVAMVVEGFTQNYAWSATPALLLADLHRAGLTLRKPPVYHRVGIPGSGGPDWLRNDYEFIVCASRPGALPWSDNTACGAAPKWKPGGAMTHQTLNGRKVARLHTKAEADGSMRVQGYNPPEKANPGNVISLKVGGGNIGSKLAHDNEAPFPERLAEFFVLSFASPGGTVCDVFSGSGTTAAVCKRHGRNFAGCDLRQSQVDLGLKRLANETALMFA